METNNNERKYLCAFIQGDRKALTYLYNKYYVQVFHFASLYVRDEDEVKDIAQEVFLRVWENRNKLDPDSDFNNYLFIVTRNYIFNLKRRIKNQYTFMISLDALANYSSSMGNNDMEAKELRMVVDLCVKSLPRRQKEVFTLSREKSFTNKEISQKLNISIKTVENHMTKALSTIRDAINKI